MVPEILAGFQSCIQISDFSFDASGKDFGPFYPPFENKYLKMIMTT